MSKRIDNTTCHCLKMRRSAWNVISFYDRMLEPSGITARQYSLLYSIREHEGCNIRELGDWTELDRSTLARSLKPLLKAELICDKKDAGTRDSKLSLTEKGHEICIQAEALWNKAQKLFEEKVGKAQVAQLEKILEAIQML